MLVEIPADLFGEELPQSFNYTPVPVTRSAPDPEAVEKASIALLEAKRPVIYAGQGIHYAEAWDSLKTLAELLEAPVGTSLSGKSAFPETHPLSLGGGGLAVPQTIFDFIKNKKKRIHKNSIFKKI